MNKNHQRSTQPLLKQPWYNKIDVIVWGKGCNGSGNPTDIRRFVMR